MESASAAKFQSPVPIVKRIGQLIFGKRPPGIFTRVTFYINSVIWVTFFVWSIISYFVLSSDNIFLREKGVSVERIIGMRGAELGYSSDEFFNRLITFNAIAIICWGIVLIGLVLLYRKISKYIYFILGGTIFYVGMMVFYIGFGFFVDDTTMFDKIALLAVVVSCLIHYYVTRDKKDEDSINFFGVDENDQEEVAGELES